MAKVKKQHLKKRADGRYCCRLGDMFFYGRTEDEALSQREQYKQSLANRTIVNGNYTVEQYAARWVNTYKTNLSTQTFNATVRTLKRFCDFKSYGHRRLDSITPIDVQEFYNSFVGFGHWSLVKIRQHLHGMFRSAIGDRLIQFDPTINAILPNGKLGTHRAITEQERQLILTTEHKLKPVVMLMLYAGLRRGEALAIDVDRDVDFNKRIIHVTRSVRWEDGCHPITVPPKTYAGVRDVPLFKPLEDVLKGIHGAVIASAKGKPLTHSAFVSIWNSYVFALETTLNNGECRRWYGKRKADTEPLPDWQTVHIQCHDLRHSFATYIRSAGVDLKTAMVWMGHADQSMLLKIYDHPDEQRLSREAQTAENYLLSMQ